MKCKSVPASEIIYPDKTDEFSIALFDQAAELSQLEKDTIKLWADSPNKRTCPKKNHPGLKRLIIPLKAALNYFGSTPSLQSTVCNAIIREMHTRQTTYWAWSENEWTKILSPAQLDFKNSARGVVQGRVGILACAYLLYSSSIIKHVAYFQQVSFACHIFGTGAVTTAIDTIAVELTRLGMRPTLIRFSMPGLLCEALLLSESAKLTNISLETLELLLQKPKSVTNVKRACIPVSIALHNLGIIHQALQQVKTGGRIKSGINDIVADEWYSWVLRWYNTSTEASSTRNGIRTKLCKIGRWLAENYPEVKSPVQWTKDICLAYVAAVNKAVLGQWMHPDYRLPKNKVGNPMKPHSKAGLIAAIRTFFLDCQEWEWISMTFDPRRYLGCPKSIKRLCGPKPRVIADDVWAKLLYAGMSFTKEDIPGVGLHKFNETVITKESFYPLEMIKAVVLVWLFTGLRQNEIQRLRVGCIKWIENTNDSNLDSVPERSVCMLTVPISKTSNEFNKPVDYLVGEAIQNWESIRPDTVSQIDYKTGEEVNFLFEWRGKRISINYINNTIIPMLCRKAGMPERDAKGNITSHRARSTIATQLFNSREPMSLFELQEWLGHSSPLSTQYYAEINPVKLTKAYTDAGYFSRNIRLIDIILDQDAIRSDNAANGAPYLYYDLSHGYCTYDFFDKCLHRMACAKCAFYQPKESSYTHILEAKENLLRLQQSIPLTEMEQRAVDEGIETYTQLTTRLSQRLKDTPTPQGPTPRELYG